MKERMALMKKLTFILIVLIVLGLSGCSTSNNETDKLSKELAEAKELLVEKQGVIEKLQEKNLETLLDADTNYGGFTFKGVLDMTVTVLDKQEGNELYPYYVIATDKDVDHNTPLLLTVERADIYNKIKVGEEHTFKVFVINVIEDNEKHIRYTFSIIE